jgi:hypothetical protein
MTRYLKIPVIGKFRDGEVLHSHFTPADLSQMVVS